MWVLLDHLNAALVATVVAMVVLGVVVVKHEDGVAASSRASAVYSLASTVDWVERDLANLGAGEGGDPVVEAAWHGPAPRFTFVTGPDTSVTAPPRTVRYERADLGDGSFELRRYEVTPAGDRLTAQSPPTLRALEIAVLDENGEETVAPHEARSVSVQLSMASPVGVGDPVEWRRRFAIHHTL